MANEIKINCKLEEYARIYEILMELARGYESGNFTSLFPYIAEDCVFESQWVLTPNTGYDEIYNYLTKKGQSIKNSGACPTCHIVELVGNINSIKDANVHVNGNPQAEKASVALFYEEGKPCLLMKQTINGETNGVIIDVKLNEKGFAKRIDLCMPEFFKYDYFYEYASIYPSNTLISSEDTEDQDSPISIKISENYYPELHFFLACAGCSFDEYGEESNPFNEWIHAIECWQEFLKAKDFDEAFESLAGVNYETGEVEKPELAKILGREGARIWARRDNSKALVHKLLEWTNTYKDSYKYVNIYGW